MVKNIVLIGFMGTGKTTVGKVLAKKLQWTFVDVDNEIENRCKMSIDKIFAEYGELYFREQEKLAIKQLRGRKNIIIATGGGAVLLDENIENLRCCGALICLVASTDIILQRLAKAKTVRPLLECEDKQEVIETLLAKRAECYKSAEFCVDTSEYSPECVADKIINYLQ